MALHLDERLIQNIQRIGQNYEIEQIVVALKELADRSENKD